MVEVVEVDQAQVHPGGPDRGELADPVDQLGGEPTTGSSGGSALVTCSGAARRCASASVRPIATTMPAESVRGARPEASRPARSHASRTRSYAAAVSATLLNGMLNSSA